MHMNRRMQAVRFGIFGAMIVAAAQAAAQSPIKKCPPNPKGEVECVDITIRYYNYKYAPPSGSQPINPKIQFIDATKGTVLGYKSYGGPACQVCNPKDPSIKCTAPCPNLPGATLVDQGAITVFQTHKNPTCYYVCNGGWCWEECTNP